ncbi:hypothetical protein PQC38_gp081 [Aeromonas phage BUCT695]|uniref:hypothetical protein n=1 Tax=Aeromonas phage BUCT695 TaxID=2908630 RepID=UPI0023293074|nr:hypothetical protein PQC38_gp081 [Aeromonas phage BUCT695]UIW10557.1 hypothetical protein [Aeromonas phage BUCT695]
MKWCVESTIKGIYIPDQVAYFFKETREEARQLKRELPTKCKIYKVTHLPKISEMSGKDNKVMLFQKVR